MDLTVVLTAMALIVPVELPDKTFVATLVLATRYRALEVWLGVGAAFAVQVLIAVTLGGLLSRLPAQPVTAAAALLFAVGAVVLLRGAGRADEDTRATQAEFAERVGASGADGGPGVAAARGRHQLRGAVPGRVGGPLPAAHRGAGGALRRSGVGLRGLLGGAAGGVRGRRPAGAHQLLRRVRLSTVRRIGGGICLLLAVLTGAQALHLLA